MSSISNFYSDAQFTLYFYVYYFYVKCTLSHRELFFVAHLFFRNVFYKDVEAEEGLDFKNIKNHTFSKIFILFSSIVEIIYKQIKKPKPCITL